MSDPPPIMNTHPEGITLALKEPIVANSNRVAYLSTLPAKKLKKLCAVIGLPTSGAKRTLAS